MSNITFSSPVVVNPYRSVRGNVLPKPGVLTIDGAGLLTITENTSNKVVLQKSVKDLNSIQSRTAWSRFTAPITAYIYVGLNEAYEVTFLSGEPAFDGGAEVYDKLLGGDTEAAVKQFKAANSALHDKDQRKQANAALRENYAEFIALAKQAGVYKPTRKTLIGYVGILLPIIIILLMAWVIIASRQ
jgi:hypothetical protein